MAKGKYTMAENKIKEFKKRVWMYYRKYGRHDLPWRQTADPYKILVSEIMLQQTQVKRVVSFYVAFTKRFPNAVALARASLSDVLRVWQGLGYNRRAKMLWQAAERIQKARTVEALSDLPGVGPYTARAIAAFAYNTDVVFVETNIRTAVLLHFFTKKTKVADREIERVLSRALPKGRAREWYSALMDYGAYLKQSGLKLNTKSKHYAKQSAFRGSLRQARGVLLKELSRGSRSEPRLLGLLGDDRASQLAEALAALRKEQLIQKRGRAYGLPR